MKNLTLSLLILLSVSSHTDAGAADIKISFNGTVNSVEAGTYQVGQMLSGFVTYDSETELTSEPTGSPPFTTNFNGAIDQFDLDSLQIDHVSFNGLAQTAFFDPIDYHVRFAVAGLDERSGLYENLDLTFQGPGLLGSIFTILEKPDLADMSSATFSYTLQKIGISDGLLQERFYGTIDSLDVQTIPTPSSLILLLTGLIGIMSIRFDYLLISKKYTAVEIEILSKEMKLYSARQPQTTWSVY